MEFKEWRYYHYWADPAWAHKCGPRGGATSGLVWVRKKTKWKSCPTCGEEVPSELRMLIELQKLDKIRPKR